MIEFLNSLSHHWAEFFLTMTIRNSLFLAIVLVVIYTLRNQNPRFLRLAALLGLAKLFIPPVFSLGSPIAETIGVGNLAGYAVIMPLEFTQLSTVSLTGYSWMFLGWLVMALLITGIAVRRCRQLILICRKSASIPLPEGVVTGTHRISLFRSFNSHSPFVIGWLHHRIVLPECAREWSRQQIRTVVAHEVAHIRQKDHWINLLQLLAVSLYFYNPLVWLLIRRLNYLQELIADNAAARALRQKPAHYAQNLLEITARMLLPHTIFFSSLYFAASSGNLKKRVRYQLEKTEVFLMEKWQLRHLVGLLLLGALMILLSCTWENEDGAKSNPLSHPEVSISKGEIVPFYAIDERPEEIKRAYPKYPEGAKTAGLEGSVVVKVLIGTHGMVEQVEVLKSVPELNQAAVDAAYQFKFKPAVKDGAPVKVWVSIPFKFKLKDSRRDEKSNKSGRRNGAQPNVNSPESDGLAAADRPLRMLPSWKLTEPPSPIETPRPNYPEGVELKGVMGEMVHVKLVIGEDGSVEDAEIAKSYLPEINQSTLEAVKKFKFTPPKINGVPVRTVLYTAINPAQFD